MSHSPVPAQETAPLSPAQRRLWALAQLDAAKAAYNEVMPFRLRGPLDVGALAAALDTLAARHQVLRTRLLTIDGEPRQVIEPPGSGFPLRVVNLTGHPTPQARAGELVRETASAPFDVESGPLARGCLTILGPDEFVLVLTAHHVVFDGWSQSLLLRELAACYRGETLPPLTWQYSDHSRRQDEWLAGDEPARQGTYWARQLAGAPPVLDLPTDRPRPPEQDHRGGRVPVVVNANLNAGLRALARDTAVTPYSVLLAGWAVLLARLSGQDDLVIGVPTANRDARAANLLGHLVNTLAVRLDLSGSPTTAGLLARTRATVRAGLDHSGLPFERVVELVNPPRSPAYNPLYQTMVAWIPSLRGVLEVPGLDVTPLDLTEAPAKCDLTLALAEEGEQLVGYLDYATALFDRATAERYVRYYLRVLTRLVAREAVDDIQLLDDAERRELLATWSTGPTPEPRPGGLVARFEAHARQDGDRTAVVSGGSRLSYAELDRRANRLAHTLLDRGVRPGQVVAVPAARSPELLVGLLGVLKAGAAYLPLDPAQPPARLAAMAADAALVLDAADLADPPSTVDIAPTVDDDPERIAYVIYTSGSTGRPKGVAVPHRAVLNLLDDWAERFGTTPGEAVSAWSSTGFDASVHELLVPLTTGAELHLVPEEIRRDPAEVLAWMRESRVVHAFLPPSFVRWIDEDPHARLAGLALRRVLTGVESLPESALARMREVLPGLEICFGYGPTEATVYATSCTRFDAVERPAPIGRPLAGTRLYLLDEHLRPVPPGVTGEVFLAGACLASGYLGRPELTAERFVPDPFVPGERMYRTGDLARWRSDGNAEFAGRRDDQLKVRGFRIEPGEVEAALLALPGVREAAVLADREDGDARLVAGVAGGTGRSAAQWREALTAHLPDYMLPSVFVELPRLPLAPNGKLDRAALLTAARGAVPPRVNTASPRDHVELTLHRIWSRVLRHPAFGITDDFFDLGGTSVSAVKVSHAAAAEFGVPLPIRDILLHRTIEALAARVRREVPPGGTGSLIEFRPGDGRSRVVCVHPAGGTAFCYLPLSAALPPSVGVLGLQAPGIEPGETPLPTVEAMAEEYLRLVGPRPDETIVLCGLSYGGLVAHEMGRRLASSGHERVSVVLLDTRPSEGAEAGPVAMAEFRDKLIRFNGMYPGIEDDQVERYFRIYNHNRLTAGAYEPPPTSAALVFVEATADGTPPGEAFWRQRAHGGLRVVPVDCGHWDLLESAGLPVVAEAITHELARLTAVAVEV
ncbi:non-ribosomal peptide synthetase [Amycolatopsis sacchari]|uniref:non-ribosomal peptide synthetase n=1 Tax=Amycolatopsis sacchari TaxID=115433 RepID=UPI003D74F0CA